MWKRISIHGNAIISHAECTEFLHILEDYAYRRSNGPVSYNFHQISLFPLSSDFPLITSYLLEWNFLVIFFLFENITGFFGAFQLLWDGMYEYFQYVEF